MHVTSYELSRPRPIWEARQLQFNFVRRLSCPVHFSENSLAITDVKNKKKQSLSQQQQPKQRDRSCVDCNSSTSVVSLNVRLCHRLKIAKNSLKIHILGVQGRSRASIMVPPESSSAVLLWYAARLCISATILVLHYLTVAEIARFERGTHIWCTRTEDSLNLGVKEVYV